MTPESYWPITGGYKAGTLPLPLSVKPQMEGRGRANMVSSKDQAKKLSQGLRRFCKEFFEDFYTKAEKRGRVPLPIEATIALGRILERATEEEWPRQPPDGPDASTEVFDLVVSRFSQQAHHEAVEAWYRHTPGLEIKRGKPGRKPNVKLAERIWALHDEGKTSREIRAILKVDGVSLSLEGVEAHSKTRRRPPKR